MREDKKNKEMKEATESDIVFYNILSTYGYFMYKVRSTYKNA